MQLWPLTFSGYPRSCPSLFADRPHNSVNQQQHLSLLFRAVAFSESEEDVEKERMKAAGKKGVISISKRKIGSGLKDARLGRWQMRRVVVKTITEKAQKDHMIIKSWHEHWELWTVCLVCFCLQWPWGGHLTVFVEAELHPPTRRDKSGGSSFLGGAV